MLNSSSIILRPDVISGLASNIAPIAFNEQFENKADTLIILGISVNFIEGFSLEPHSHKSTLSQP
jgi:hypothetical protein